LHTVGCELLDAILDNFYVSASHQWYCATVYHRHPKRTAEFRDLSIVQLLNAELRQVLSQGAQQCIKLFNVRLVLHRAWGERMNIYDAPGPDAPILRASICRLVKQSIGR